MSQIITVLAVDDDMINRKLLKSMLQKNPHIKEVIEATNGQEAIDQIRSRGDIDLVLLDIVMPILNGIETLKVLRSDQSIRQMPVIVLTTDETKKNQSIELGANDFLTKPIRSDELMKKINSMIL